MSYGDWQARALQHFIEGVVGIGSICARTADALVLHLPVLAALNIETLGEKNEQLYSSKTNRSGIALSYCTCMWKTRVIKLASTRSSTTLATFNNVTLGTSHEACIFKAAWL